jgi:K+-transporting ATPase ATPase C chain
MKQQMLPALKLTLACMLLCCGAYTVLILGIAQFAPNKGEGNTISLNGQVKGYDLEGQGFTLDKYFNSRPSAAGYNAAGSSGSNKGPSNPDYLKEVNGRIDSFLVHNPSVKKEEIPAELITASGSGLDPDLSPEGALVQVARIAKTRNLPEDKIKELVNQQIQKPLLGFFGPEKVKILKLNLELDKIK